MAGHKAGCWYPRALAEGAQYERSWPDSCRRCAGWGWLGGSYDEFGNFDGEPCECLEQGKCPRCAGGVISDSYWNAGHYVNCDSCGFIEGTTQGRPMIVDEPCECLELWPGWPDVDYFADRDEARDQAAGDPEPEPYPYELSDFLYDVYRERGIY